MTIMEPQTKTKMSKDTVTMTVEINKSSRSKLARIKGIYGCDSLACAVSSTIDDIVIPDLLRLVADREGSTQSDPVPTRDQPIGEPTATNTSTTDEERKMIDFCKKLLIDLQVADMEELDTYIDSDIVIIENKLLPKRSPVGEIPDDTPEWGE